MCYLDFQFGNRKFNFLYKYPTKKFMQHKILLNAGLEHFRSGLVFQQPRLLIKSTLGMLYCSSKADLGFHSVMYVVEIKGMYKM